MTTAKSVASQVFPVNNTVITFYQIEGRPGYWFRAPQIGEALEYKANRNLHSVLRSNGPVAMPTVKASLGSSKSYKFLPAETVYKVCRKSRRRHVAAKFEAWLNEQILALNAQTKALSASSADDGMLSEVARIASIIDTTKFLNDFVKFQQETYNLHPDSAFDQLMLVANVYKSKIA
jgi:hypothetical protein